MPITETDWMELVQRLELTPIEDGWLAGRVRDFPVAIKIMVSDESTVFLAQIRLSKKVEPDFSPQFSPDSKLAELIANKTAELCFDPTLAWLTLTNPPEDVAEVDQVLAEFFAVLGQGGLAGTQACYYCEVNNVDGLTFYDGRILQICESCFEQRLKKVPQARPVDLVPLLIVSLLAGLAGAMAWALVWIGWDQLFVALGTDSIRLPHLVMGLLALCIAFLTGGPAGWIIKRLPSRTKTTGAAAAVLAVVMALFLGELLYTMVFIYKAVNVIAPVAAVRMLPRVWAEGVPLFKMLAAGVTLAVAVAMARPAKPKIEP